MKDFLKGFITFCVMAVTFCLTGITAEAYGVTQTTQDKNSVTISWVPESDAIEYYVGIGEDSSAARAAAETKAIVLPATATSYTITGLAEGTAYYVNISYKTLGYDGTTEYTYSAGTQEIMTLPGKVMGVNQTKWWYYINQVDFAWTDQTAADYEYIVKDNKNKVVNSTNTSSNSGGCSNVSNSKVYTVRVRAYVTINNQKYYGEYSDVAYLFTQPMVKKAKVSGGKLTLSWGKVSGVTGYDVYVSTKEKTGYKKVKSVSKSKGSVTISKFKGKKFSTKKTYYIYIVGKKKVGKVTYTSGRHYTYSVKKTSGKLNWTFD